MLRAQTLDRREWGNSTNASWVDSGGEGAAVTSVLAVRSRRVDRSRGNLCASRSCSSSQTRQPDDAMYRTRSDLQ